MTLNEAKKLAFANAAGIVENYDIESLFGTEYEQADWPMLEKAQAAVVAALRKRGEI